MKRVILVCYVTAFILHSNFSRAQSGINPAYAELMQHALDSLREEYEVMGMYAALYIPGKGMWKGVTGVSDAADDIDTSMLFDMGSITKTFAASEILKLVDEGIITLDDTISNLLPTIENVTPEITVRQLLQHKSGLAEYLTLDWQDAMFDDLTRRWYSPEAMDSFLTAPTGSPGGPWSYCNTNYVLLGMIAEKFRGDSLHIILRNDFLSPLQLNDTYMEMFESYENEIADNWSAPNFDPDLAVNVSGYPHEALFTSTSFAGGLFCTAPDLATWGYNLYSGNVLSDSSLAEMLNFTFVGSYFNGYGLGCMRFSNSGNTYYGHAGNFFGYAASMLYYPQDSICLALLVNQDCISAYIAMPLMKIALDNLFLTTGINNPATTMDLMIYPNPSIETLNVQLPWTGEVIVNVFDVCGRQFYSSHQEANHLSIDVSRFPEGMYILEIITGNKTVFQENFIVN